MARSARLFLCARCRDQVLLCSHCDHGQLYCGRTCSAAARQEHRHEAARRYQRSRGGRLKHSARTACWRTRQRLLRQANAGGDINKVTHQGCPNLSVDASLLVCDTPSTNEITTLTEAATTTATPFGTLLVCRRCAHALLAHVRLDWLRRSSTPKRSHHDHPT